MVEADGQAFGWATVRVTTVGEGAQKEFLRDAVGECVADYMRARHIIIYAFRLHEYSDCGRVSL